MESRAPDERDAAQEREGAVGVGRAFGSFGELVQGMLPGEDRDFLITLPIDAGTTAVFRYSPTRTDVRVHPAHKRKSRLLVMIALEVAGRAGGGELELDSSLPEGKGLASSSADLVATARAVGAAVGVAFDDAVVESLLRRIEPSDGVMYDGVVAFYHREVRLHSRLGVLPRLAIVGHDEGGQVDTINHNRRPKPYTSADKWEYDRLLTDMAAAVRNVDLAEVGRIATRSAVLNARLRPRRGFDELSHACADVGGFGLVLAHSGTMLGVLLSADDPELAGKTEHIRASCRTLGGTVSVRRSLGVVRDYPVGA